MELQQILDSAVAEQTSDIHFVPNRVTAEIFFRKEQGIELITTIRMESYLIMIQKVKALGHLNISEKRLPQDGVFQYEGFSFRISFLRSIYGESLVIRRFGKELRQLSDLGFPNQLTEHLLHRIETVQGIHLIAGETGMGKTTTFYGLMNAMAGMKKKVLTIEDPVENTIEGILQCQVNELSGYTYDRAVFAALRQDPDIIGIGEVRNSETAHMLLRAALTGHPVVSTIHAYSYKSAYEKLKDFGLREDELDFLLRTVFNQKLRYEKGERKAYGVLEENQKGTAL